MIRACRSRGWAGRSRRLSRAALGGALLVILVGCKASRSEPTSTAAPAPLAAEPERFRFDLPSGYVRHELRGEGSETLLAPPEARVQRGSNGIRVDAGSDFALEVAFEAALTALPQEVPGAQRVASDKDLVVFKGADGYRFLVLRELVPEWDENDRRRVVCRSAGSTTAGRPEPELKAFSRPAVEHMVAACRTLDLPHLE